MNTIPRPQEVPQEEWTPQVQSLKATLQTLLSDLNTEGWDLPAKIYFLEEPADDPQLVLSGILPNHPTIDLQGAFRAGMRVRPDVLGLVVASEAWRHLTADELFERKPDMLQRLKDSMIEQGFDLTGVPDEALREMTKNHYYERVLPNLGPAGTMPDEMRVELRHVSAVLRDGTSLAVAQSRDKDDVQFQVFPEGGFANSGVPTAMYLFLHGLFPDAETEDPMQSVADYLALQEIEKLEGES